MYLNALHLIQFRNHPNKKLEFNKKIIGICGKNGTGKSNLLDSIYMLGLTKSYFNRNDASNIGFNLDGYAIEGIYTEDSLTNKVRIVCRQNEKKEVYYNQTKYLKLSEHIGKFPCVFISPEKMCLIQDGQSERRRFLDIILSQIYPEYLTLLTHYNKVLAERNALLKNQFHKAPVDLEVLQIQDNFLVLYGTKLFHYRSEFFPTLQTLTKDFYQQLSNGDDGIQLAYHSSLQHQPFEQLLLNNRQRDIELKRTNIGIHRDEFQFYIDQQPIQNYGSQGQKKSLLLALTLAEWTLLFQHLNKKPILIIDDLLEHLDQQRLIGFLDILKNDFWQQIFISSPLPQRLQEILIQSKIPFQIYEI
ncbi:MAG: DNA replication and repair protein RecF [Sediminibacterium sp.]|nr:DNA replication and repair protein RecF [Sediminibacterium sp.]